MLKKLIEQYFRTKQNFGCSLDNNLFPRIKIESKVRKNEKDKVANTLIYQIYTLHWYKFQ